MKKILLILTVMFTVNIAFSQFIEYEGKYTDVTKNKVKKSDNKIVLKYTYFFKDGTKVVVTKPAKKKNKIKVNAKKKLKRINERISDLKEQKEMTLKDIDRIEKLIKKLEDKKLLFVSDTL